MSVTRTNPRRTTRNRKGRPAVSARAVQEMLLDLAYRLHTTRVVRVLPAASVAASH